MLLESKSAIGGLTLLFLATLLCGCQTPGGETSQPSPLTTTPNDAPDYGRMLTPARDTLLHRGDSLWVTVAPIADGFDSVAITLSSRPLTQSTTGGKIGLASDDFPTGVHWLQATFWHNGAMSIEIRRIKIYAGAAPQDYTYVVEKEYPHDEGAYTQGLVYRDGFLYESTGQRGESRLRKVELATGNVLQEHSLADTYFGEGLEYLNGRFYQLTWTSYQGFVYDAKTFDSVGSFHYNTQGWGLTTDGQSFYLSDGTENLYVLDTATLQVRRVLQVYTESEPLYRLNELEWVEGRIYANIYTTDKIAIIDPRSGAVEGLIHCEGLLRPSAAGSRAEVLNGIAYDPAGKNLYLTGKYWPYLYRVKVKPDNDRGGRGLR